MKKSLNFLLWVMPNGWNVSPFRHFRMVSGYSSRSASIWTVSAVLEIWKSGIFLSTWNEGVQVLLLRGYFYLQGILFRFWAPFVGWLKHFCPWAAGGWSILQSWIMFQTRYYFPDCFAVEVILIQHFVQYCLNISLFLQFLNINVNIFFFFR